MPTKKLTLSERLAQLERQLAEMRDLIATQNAKPDALKPALIPAKAMAVAAGAISPGASAPVAAPKRTAAVVPVKADQEESVSPEVLVVIAAAVAHFLGKSVRIRSARLVHPEGMSPWAQQGRVFVQASHNLALAR